MKDIEQSFTAPQIEFLTTSIFDVLSANFGYSLSHNKRKKVMSLALHAERGNYDALLQRAERLHGTGPIEDVLNQIPFEHVRPLFEQLSACKKDAEPLLVSMKNLRISDWHLLVTSQKVSVNNAVDSTGVFAKLEGGDAFFSLLTRIHPVLNITLLRLLQVAIAERKTTSIHFRYSVDGNVGDLNTSLPDFSAPLSNSNCLSGMRCPCCGAQSRFFIETLGTVPGSCSEEEPDGVTGTFWATWEDDGSADTEGDTEFPEDAGCICLTCRAQHPISAFQEPVEMYWSPSHSNE